DGRFVTFPSLADNLVTGDTGEIDVFVRDRTAGTTERASVTSAGVQVSGGSHWSAISADGRFVAFDSQASDLVAGDTNGTYDIFVHDRLTGTTERDSVRSTNQQATGHSQLPAISADGSVVAFISTAPDLVAGDTNNVVDVFAHHRLTGTTERVS